MMSIGRIIRFKENASSSAAQWCRKHNLHGKVVGEESGLLQIDVGLYYKIYASPDHVQILGTTELEPLSQELKHSAPHPEHES